MFESKYSKVLTLILVIVIIAIIGLLVFLGYDYYQKYVITKDTGEFVDNFEGEFADGEANDNETGNTTEGNISDQLTNANNNSSNTGKQTYKGFGVLGTMKIPAINFSYPVLEKVTKSSIETSVAFLCGPGLNEAGNSVIIGHNYRNGLFFSNNKKLNIGDKIYIRDITGRKLTYNIYDKFEASPEDTSFYQRDTGGVAEVTLSTCTDDSSARIIILARAE